MLGSVIYIGVPAETWRKCPALVPLLPLGISFLNGALILFADCAAVSSPIQESDASSSSASGIQILSNRCGAKVKLVDDSLIYKRGFRVRNNEEVAMELVSHHTDVPVPKVFFSRYLPKDGTIAMTVIPGSPLHLSWNDFDDSTKKSICEEIWSLIAKLRQIPQPDELRHLYLCLADGSVSRDVLIKNFEGFSKPLLNDSAVRDRILQCYLHCNGRRYANELLEMLPRSEHSVFTHGDISPKNLMIDENHHITGIIDWETAGWYPDYWEYINIMAPSPFKNWAYWMDCTAPEKCDLSGITAARMVLLN